MILVSIIVVSVALGTSFFVGWMLRKLRERDERKDDERLKSLEEIDFNLKKYYNEQRERQTKERGGNNGA